MFDIIKHADGTECDGCADRDHTYTMSDEAVARMNELAAEVWDYSDAELTS